MRFDNETGSKAGKISKRGRSLPVELRNSLNELINQIINELNYESLNNTQKIKLLDVALKYSLPRLSIEKSIEELEPPKELKITIVGRDGEVIETHKNVLDENFQFKNALGGK
mgnify:FL=1|jgi:hypothetical protein|tara:strand:- start:1248 stop:1586 length:339 start_codon:yes stop_codon:yes gene_type:complete